MNTSRNRLNLLGPLPGPQGRVSGRDALTQEFLTWQENGEKSHLIFSLTSSQDVTSCFY